MKWKGEKPLNSTVEGSTDGPVCLPASAVVLRQFNQRVSQAELSRGQSPLPKLIILSLNRSQGLRSDGRMGNSSGKEVENGGYETRGEIFRQSAFLGRRWIPEHSFD
ncbi:hypothetical protein HPP92_026727 [Vanilla planifolia]|uniref:Uncharacterized protein n=1 Tax=Vanilla planifolia TaxID=51239 RepID=A0A835PFF9_VANPL|nr:hypothetical protein HPP92_026727 [Vanilla planifolia]